MTILILFFWLLVSVGLGYVGYRANSYFGEKTGLKDYYGKPTGPERSEFMQILSGLFMIICMVAFFIILGNLIILSVQLGY